MSEYNKAEKGNSNRDEAFVHDVILLFFDGYFHYCTWGWYIGTKDTVECLASWNAILPFTSGAEDEGVGSVRIRLGRE